MCQHGMCPMYKMSNIKRTNAPSNYIQPSEHAIREAAEAVGLNTYSPQLIADMSNIAAGGSLIPSAEWREELKQSVKRPSGDSNSGYKYKRYGEDREHTATISKDYAHEINVDRMVKANEKVCEFIRGIDFSKIDADSPLNKAVYALKSIYQSDATEGEDDFDGETLPVFNKKRADKAADKVNNIFDTIDTLDDTEIQLLSDDDEYEGGSGRGSESRAKVSLINEMSEGADVWVNTARNLENLTRFRVNKGNHFVPDNEGDDVTKRQIAGLHELHKIPHIEYALPKVYRIYKAATRQTAIRQRVFREDDAQLLYVLIDCSASMHYAKIDPKKKLTYKNSTKGRTAINAAGGILFNRLKSVVKGEAQMYFRFFDIDLFEEHKATTPQEARECIKLFKEEKYDGDGTRIEKCLMLAVDRINELLQNNTLSDRPELCIITDGEDNVRNLKPIDFTKHGLRLHSFMVGNSNKQLAQLSRDTGGVGVENIS